jgi:hypothetical protein
VSFSGFSFAPDAVDTKLQCPSPAERNAQICELSYLPTLVATVSRSVKTALPLSVPVPVSMSMSMPMRMSVSKCLPDVGTAILDSTVRRRVPFNSHWQYAHCVYSNPQLVQLGRSVMGSAAASDTEIKLPTTVSDGSECWCPTPHCWTVDHNRWDAVDVVVERLNPIGDIGCIVLPI